MLRNLSSKEGHFLNLLLLVVVVISEIPLGHFKKDDDNKDMQKTFDAQIPLKLREKGTEFREEEELSLFACFPASASLFFLSFSSSSSPHDPPPFSESDNIVHSKSFFFSYFFPSIHQSFSPSFFFFDCPEEEEKAGEKRRSFAQNH